MSPTHLLSLLKMKTQVIIALLLLKSASCTEEGIKPLPEQEFEAIDHQHQPRAADESKMMFSSGSGIFSGSGHSVVPTHADDITTATRAPEYNTMIFISLTYADLTLQQYNDNHLEQKIHDLLVSILHLDIRPLVVFDSEGKVIVYFSGETASTLEYYVKVLGSSNNSQWLHLSESYDLQAIEVKDVHVPMPWWHWLIIGLTVLMGISAYMMLTIVCCCRYCVLMKIPPKNAAKDDQIGLLDKGHQFQMQEVKERKELVRKISRVNFQSRSNMHFYSHPLSIADLEQVVINPSPLFSEYTTVPSNMVTLAEVPAGAEEKNRYRDVLPNPHTRVALFLKFGVANSDYINANHIRGYKNSATSYIATQGPLAWTAADFWRMIWEQKCSTIVMVTNLEEKGMVKCIRYWPEEKRNHSTVYEDLEVRLKRRIITKNHSTTTFMLQHKDKMVSREITQFWFTGWPDHGVPSAEAVLEFLLHVRKYTSFDMPGPIVVHCSAGIGRTGVFIGADIAIQQLDYEGEVDLLQILCSLRQDRGGMIQTKEQYLFLHKVLLEYARLFSQEENR